VTDSEDIFNDFLKGVNDCVNFCDSTIKNIEKSVNKGIDDFVRNVTPAEKDLSGTLLTGAVGLIPVATKVIDKAVKMQNNPEEKITSKDVFSTIGLATIGLTPMFLKIACDNAKNEEQKSEMEEKIKKSVEYYENADIPFDERLKTARTEIEKSLKYDEKKVMAKILLFFFFQKFEKLLSDILERLIANHPESSIKTANSIKGKIDKIKKFGDFQDSTLNALSEDTLKQISDLRNKLAHGDSLTNENLETALPAFDLIKDFLLKYPDK
jgi:hypothetical protein